MPTNTSQPVHFIHPEFVYIRVIGACVFAIIGLPVNIGALYVVKRSGRQGSHNMLLAYLFIVELSICVYGLPAFAYDQWTMTGFNRSIACQLHTYFYFVMQGTIPMAMLSITLNRYLMVRHTARIAHIISPAKTKCLVLGSVVIVMLTLLPPLFNCGAVFDQSPITGVCTSLIRPDTKVFNIITQLLILVLPVCAMFFCYGMILRTLKVQNARIDAVRHHTGVFNLPDMQRSMHRRQHTIRVTWISAITVVIFVITYSPFILGTLFPNQLDTYVYSAVATVLTFSHSVTSPVIYVCGDPHLLDTLKGKFGNKPSTSTRPIIISMAPVNTTSINRGRRASVVSVAESGQNIGSSFELQMPRQEFSKA